MTTSAVDVEVTPAPRQQSAELFQRPVHPAFRAASSLTPNFRSDFTKAAFSRSIATEPRFALALVSVRAIASSMTGRSSSQLGSAGDSSKNFSHRIRFLLPWRAHRCSVRHDFGQAAIMRARIQASPARTVRSRQRSCLSGEGSMNTLCVYGHAPECASPAPLAATPPKNKPGPHTASPTR